jgi:hypothetical protein
MYSQPVNSQSTIEDLHHKYFLQEHIHPQIRGVVLVNQGIHQCGCLALLSFKHSTRKRSLRGTQHLRLLRMRLLNDSPD